MVRCHVCWQPSKPRRLFTALEVGALGEGLLPVLTQLTARHKVIVAAVHDPALAELAVRRGDAPGVYAAAAAPADVFASRVADAYLAMKAAGRL
jgi:hypothetical protein